MDSGHCAYLEDEVSLNSEYYKVKVLVIAPHGIVMDDHATKRIVEQFADNLKAEYEE